MFKSLHISNQNFQCVYVGKYLPNQKMLKTEFVLYNEMFCSTPHNREPFNLE